MAISVDDIDNVAYRVRLGQRIRGLRERRDWTQKTFGDKMGWDTRAVHEVETPGDSSRRKKKRVRYDELVRIARVFDITMHELLTGLGDPGEPVIILGSPATATATARAGEP
jgi:transcriptional regulator with XRE-family HTH domain